MKLDYMRKLRVAERMLSGSKPVCSTGAFFPHYTLAFFKYACQVVLRPDYTASGEFLCAS